MTVPFRVDAQGRIMPRTPPGYPTIGPQTVFGPPAEEPTNPWLAAYRSAKNLAGEASDFIAPMIPGGQAVVPFLKMLGQGLEHDVGNVAGAVKNRNVPGAGGRGAIFEAALPLAMNFYPMGAAPSVERAAARELGETGAQAMSRELAAMTKASEAARVARDMPIIERMRNEMPGLDLSHYTDEELRSEAALTGQRLGAAQGLSPIVAQDDMIAIAHHEEYLKALAKEKAVRDAQKAAAGPSRSNSLSRDAMLRQERGHAHDMPGVTPGADKPAAPSGGRVTLHESLDRETAIAKNREYATQGLATEMKKNPDGTFRIEQKGAGAAAPKVAERIAAKDERREKAFELAGFSPEERARWDELNTQIEALRVKREGVPSRIRRPNEEYDDINPDFQAIGNEMRPLRGERDVLDDRLFQAEEAQKMGMHDALAKRYVAAHGELNKLKAARDAETAEWKALTDKPSNTFEEEQRLNELYRNDEKWDDAYKAANKRIEDLKQEAKETAGMDAKTLEQYESALNTYHSNDARIQQMQKEPWYNMTPTDYTDVERQKWDDYRNLFVERDAAYDRMEEARGYASATREAGGLMPSEAKKLEALRKSHGEIEQGIQQYEALQQAGDPRVNTPEYERAYAEAQAQYATIGKDIDKLAMREHLPPRAEKSLVKAEPKSPAPSYTYEEGTRNAESGFQSRAMTVLDNDYAGKSMSADEWFETLRNDPRIPKDEVDAVLGPQSQRLLLAEQQGDKISADAIYQKFRDDSPASTLETRITTNDDTVDDSWDARYEAAREQLQRDRERWITRAVREEQDYVRERMSESTDETIGSALENRDAYLEDFKTAVDEVLGPEAGEKFLKSLENRQFEIEPESAEYHAEVFEGSPFQITARNLEDGPGYTSDMYDMLINDRFAPQMRSVLDDLLPKDPNQLALSDDIRRDFTPEQHEQLRSLFDDALAQQDEAVQAGRERYKGYDDDEVERAARESIEENLDQFEDVPDPDDTDQVQRLAEDIEIPGSGEAATEYHGYQRIDEDAPYAEIKVYSPGVGKASHYNDSRDLAAWARTEDHGDTKVMIEAQSDVAQRGRKSGKTLSPIVKNTDRWAKLSTGASLHQAAAEKFKYFGWATAENRISTASLAQEAAEITYEKAVPKALKDFYKQLGEPMPEIEDTGEGFFRIAITPEMRKKILKSGLPALGIGGVAVAGAKKE